MLGTRLEETRVFREAQEEKAKTIALNFLKLGMLSIGWCVTGRR
ncbi:hypothetical protein ACN4EG_04360 [Alkalinema pantanalense CENA528]